MTAPPLSELSAEEINDAIATLVMGLHIETLGKYKCYADANGKYLSDDESDFSESLAAAFEVETEIERRGLEQLYAYLLTNLLGFPDEHYLWTYDNLWTMLHATPRQRCEAALSAVATRPADASEKEER